MLKTKIASNYYTFIAGQVLHCVLTSTSHLIFRAILMLTQSSVRSSAASPGNQGSMSTSRSSQGVLPHGTNPNYCIILSPSSKGGSCFQGMDGLSPRWDLISQWNLNGQWKAEEVLLWGTGRSPWCRAEGVVHST